MAIITVSRGTFSGGKTIAECLSKRLGYRCIDRDMLVRKAATRRVSEHDLRAALELPPAFPGRFNHTRYIYLALIQAALVDEIRTGHAIYHGLAGHLLLRGTPGLLRLRIIAPMDYRTRMAQERLNLSRSDAIAHIEAMDRDRRKWTQFLYGVDWGDPSLYDLVINLERTTIEQACHLIASLVECGGLELSPEGQAALDDLALASRVRAALAQDPFTQNLEFEVESQAGKTVVRGDGAEEVEDIQRVVGAVPGVADVTIESASRVG
ncbi:MAG TPA: cytidylate kinase-like family protein [Bryobacteraceae bacterium]|nr:cytidylate kinase-like family protein [Bryobacteraceae bacterium]